MKFEFDSVTLLKVTAKPYDFNGRKGISYKGVVLVEGEIYNVKLDENLYTRLQSIVEQKGSASFQVKTVSSGAFISLFLVDFSF